MHWRSRGSVDRKGAVAGGKMGTGNRWERHSDGPGACWHSPNVYGLGEAQEMQ
jgi:uncharacterized membrane-anchored protein